MAWVKKHKCQTVLLVILALLVAGSLFDVLTNPETAPEMNRAAIQYIDDTNKPTPPIAFYQDGCSLFPDQLLWHDFRSACFDHDIKYWAGGAPEERKIADRELMNSVKQTGPLGPVFAPLMYVGVRVFGDSFVTKAVGAHWGYGWD
tara:strand:+ start:5210 stop:5647 length:438 start_codon:yes stop_codon:yes gene_type:complete